MLDIFNTPTPQGANYQAFYGGGSLNQTWIKPRGASMVRMLLIGAGGGGASSSVSTGGGGGGSGVVTEWIGPAIFIPDQLSITVGAGGSSGNAGTSTQIRYQGKSSTTYLILTANAGNAGSGTSGGTAVSAASNNYFGASGIFKSTAGQAGANAGSNITASTTTFLSGGAGGGNATTAQGFAVLCNYGYPTIAGGAALAGGNGRDGFFLTQPIMIGAGGSGGGGSTSAAGGIGGIGGIGCGGGGAGACTSGTSLGGKGGDGAVFIWSW